MKPCKKTFLTGLLLCIPLALPAQEIVGTLKNLRGEATLERQGQRRAVRVGESLQARDRIQTGAEGYVGIGFTDQSALALGPRSDVDLSKYRFNPVTHQGEQQVRVRAGSLASISGKIAKASPEAVQFNAGTVTLGVRGTQFVMAVHPASEGRSATHWTDASGQPLRSPTGLCWQTTEAGFNTRSDCLPDQFVLLPDRDGHVGRILVKTADREWTVLSAYAGVEVAPRDARTLTLGEAEVHRRYGAVLTTLPPATTTFVLRFMSGSSTQLTPDGPAVLDQVRAALARWPVVADVDVVGHTDTQGDADRNDQLSLERAQAVVRLMGQGMVAPERLHVSGRGERQLLVPAPDNTPEERNRRVEITLY